MAENIPMLALSPTMEEGVIVKWVKSEGDRVSESEVICEVETDKATMEYESPVEGTLLQILVAEGEKAKVGDAIAVIGEEGEEVEKPATEDKEKEEEKPKESEKESAEEETPEKKEKPAEESKQAKEEGKAPEEEKKEVEKKKPAAKEKSGEEKKVKASPLARKLAEENDLDLSTIEGSGPDGRIVKADIDKALGQGAPEMEAEKRTSQAPELTEFVAGESKLKEETIKVSQVRKVIAQRLSESKFSAPHYYLTLSVMVDDLIAARKKFNTSGEKKVSLNAFLVKFAAIALEQHPEVNASWMGDKILRHGSADVALAVAQKEGLITPIVRQAERKGVLQIDEELKDLIDRAQKGKLKPDEYSDSTLTITNLGSFGIEEFTAIINPPNSVILAVGKMMKMPVVDENDRITIRQVMKLTLSCDHRIIDGAVGAAFLRDLKDIVEYPVASLL